MKKRQLRSSFSILFTKASETFVHELDSRVARERVLTVELRIEDKHRLNGCPFGFGSRSSAFERGVVLNSKISPMPEENHVLTRYTVAALGS